MTLPSWRDTKFGTRVRGALWLETEVGEGNTFTKAALREAFPEVSQIDRRLRDLRDHSWIIHTQREDPGLKHNEQRYVKKGAEVWVPGQTVPKQKARITSAERTRTMQRDHYLCRSCGIGAGEKYADGAQEAQLDIARRKVRLEDGREELQLVTECNRCHTGSRTEVKDTEGMLRDLSALSELERKVFTGWIKADCRTQSHLEQLWGRYRTLPAESRITVARAVIPGED